MLALLRVRFRAGLAIGALGGEDRKVAQVIILMALFALLAGFFFLSHPFIQRRTNLVEGALSVCVFLFLCVNLWTAEQYEATGTGQEKLKKGRGVTTGVMGALLAAAVLPVPNNRCPQHRESYLHAHTPRALNTAVDLDAHYRVAIR